MGPIPQYMFRYWEAMGFDIDTLRTRRSRCSSRASLTTLFSYYMSFAVAARDDNPTSIFEAGIPGLESVANDLVPNEFLVNDGVGPIDPVGLR
jgi:hypothetical protein